MPKYRRGRGKLVKKHRNFEHPYQLIHFLSSTREKEYKPFRDIAKQYLDGSIVPGHRIRKNALQHIAYNDPKKFLIKTKLAKQNIRRFTLEKNISDYENLFYKL